MFNLSYGKLQEFRRNSTAPTGLFDNDLFAVESTTVWYRLCCHPHDIPSGESLWTACPIR